MIKWLLLPLVSAILWRTGGYCWKPARRFLMPAFGTIFAFLYPRSKLKKSWKVIWIMLSCIGLSMGYGESHTIFDRILFSIICVLPTLFLGLSIWQIIFPLSFLFFFWASNKYHSATLYRWHFVELYVGAIWGLMLASVL